LLSGFVNFAEGDFHAFDDIGKGFNRF